MSIYTIHDELKYCLECRWEKKSQVENRNSQDIVGREFPVNKKDLILEYNNLELVFNKKYHPNVTLGAAVRGDGLLTDHGVGHVMEVMHHAYVILGNNIKYLYGYEIYLLLLAIHFHDLGNIYGREQHEQEIDKVIIEMGDALPLDDVEKEFVVAISKAHGGFCDGDKDTIRYVSVDESCNGIKVRAKMLAAVLRFADEISDDFTRAEYGNITIPTENEIYHTYSKCLEPVNIEGETIKFHFRIPFQDTQTKFGKGSKKIYLYDEILNRITKCMREMEYCRKYADGFINITTLNVTIDIMKQENYRKLEEKLSFRLNLRGYPNERRTSIMDYLENNPNGIYNDNSETVLKYKKGIELKNAMKRGR